MKELKMDSKMKENFSIIMYFLTKEVAVCSFEDFLDELGVSYEEWCEIKYYLKEKYNTDTYV